METVSENSPVLEAGDLNSLLEQFEATELPDTTISQDFRSTEGSRSPLDSSKSSRKRPTAVESNQNIYPTRRKPQAENGRKPNKNNSLLRKGVVSKADVKNKNGCGCPENTKINGKGEYCYD